MLTTQNAPGRTRAPEGHRESGRGALSALAGGQAQVMEGLAQDPPHRWLERMLRDATDLERRDPRMALTMRICAALLERAPVYSDEDFRRAAGAVRQQAIEDCQSIAEAFVKAGRHMEAKGAQTAARHLQSLPLPVPPAVQPWPVATSLEAVALPVLAPAAAPPAVFAPMAAAAHAQASMPVIPDVPSSVPPVVQAQVVAEPPLGLSAGPDEFFDAFADEPEPPFLPPLHTQPQAAFVPPVPPVVSSPSVAMEQLPSAFRSEPLVEPPVFDAPIAEPSSPVMDAPPPVAPFVPGAFSAASFPPPSPEYTPPPQYPGTDTTDASVPSTHFEPSVVWDPRALEDELEEEEDFFGLPEDDDSDLNDLVPDESGQGGGTLRAEIDRLRRLLLDSVGAAEAQMKAEAEAEAELANPALLPLSEHPATGESRFAARTGGIQRGLAAISSFNGPPDAPGFPSTLTVTLRELLHLLRIFEGSPPL